MDVADEDKDKDVKVSYITDILKIVTLKIIFSSPGQSAGRAIVLPLELMSALAKC